MQQIGMRTHLKHGSHPDDCHEQVVPGHSCEDINLLGLSGIELIKYLFFEESNFVRSHPLVSAS